MCGCSAAGEQTFLHTLGCTCTTDVIEIDSTCVLVVQCSIISISCKTGVVLVHSENDGADQQFFCLAYLDPHWCTLNMQFYTAMSTQTGDTHDMSMLVSWKQC